MAVNVINAPAGGQMGGSRELIAHGTLAWAIIQVQPFNLDQGIVAQTSDKKAGNAFIKVELTVIEPGPHAGRKLWGMIAVRGEDTKGGQQYLAGGQAALRHIVEVGRNAHPTKNPGGYVLGANRPDGDEGAYLELNDMKCAIEIGVEVQTGTRTDGSPWPDKNVILNYLSPNPESPTHKKFERLVAGQFEPPEGTKAPAPKSPVTNGGTPLAPAAAPGAKPGWLSGQGQAPAAPLPAAAPPTPAHNMAAQIGGNNSAPW